jgi:hypothetical protein
MLYQVQLKMLSIGCTYVTSKNILLLANVNAFIAHSDNLTFMGCGA